jgi:uncharacterized membrane protein YgcG
VDEAGLLSSQQLQALSALTSDGRVGIHIAGSTQGQPLKAFSDNWALAQKASTPSLEVAVTVVPGSHQVYISISQQARGGFTSADAGRVIHQILIPSFRASDWSGGLTKATQTIEAQLGGVSSTTTTTTTPAAPAPAAQSEPEKTGPDWGLVVIVLLIAAVIGGLFWSSWNRKFRHFEAVVSAGQPDFPMVAEVKAQPEVRDALEALQDLHSALPIDYSKRTAYYHRRKDDFRAAYETCFRAQEAWDLEKRRETEAQQRFEALRARADSLPEAEREKFLALDAQYRASGSNAGYLLQNMVMMDLMMHAMSPTVMYENVIVEDDRRFDGGWQSGSDDGFDGGSGSDSGDGGNW